MSNRRKGSWISKIFVMLVTTLICFGIVEIVLRSFLPAHQAGVLGAYQYDEELGIRIKPGIHFFKTTDFQQEIRVNKLGTVNFQESFDGYENLVFAIGDSYTQGTGLPSDASYPAQLDLTLNEDPNGYYQKKFGVVNLGLAAYGGEQSLIALKRWSQTVGQPKYILYLGCDNDAEDDILFKSGYRHNHIVDGSPRWGSFVGPMQFLTNDLQLGIRLKLIIGQSRRNALGATSELPAEGPSPAEQSRSVLERVKQHADANGAVMVLSWSDRTRSYDWSKKWAAENGVRFADWRPYEAAVTAAIHDLPTENQHSGGHHRTWVNRLMAEEFARQIAAK